MTPTCFEQTAADYRLQCGEVTEGAWQEPFDADLTEKFGLGPVRPWKATVGDRHAARLQHAEPSPTAGRGNRRATGRSGGCLGWLSGYSDRAMSLARRQSSWRRWPNMPSRRRC